MLAVEPHHFVYVGGACVWAVEGLRESKSGVTLLLIQAAHIADHFYFYSILELALCSVPARTTGQRRSYGVPVRESHVSVMHAVLCDV